MSSFAQRKSWNRFGFDLPKLKLEPKPKFRKWEIILRNTDGTYHRAFGNRVSGVKTIKFYKANQKEVFAELEIDYLERVSKWSELERIERGISAGKAGKLR